MNRVTVVLYGYDQSIVLDRQLMFSGVPRIDELINHEDIQYKVERITWYTDGEVKVTAYPL